MNKRSTDAEFLRALAADLVIKPEEQTKWGEAPERLRELANSVEAPSLALEEHIWSFLESEVQAIMDSEDSASRHESNQEVMITILYLIACQLRNK